MKTNMIVNEFRETGEKFQEVDMKNIPAALILQLTTAQLNMTNLSTQMENEMKKATELMKQAIVLDGINKSEK